MPSSHLSLQAFGYSSTFSFQDALPALGFKTYFVRASSNASTIKGAKVITQSPTKKIPKSVETDITIYNDVGIFGYGSVYIGSISGITFVARIDL